MLHRLAYQLKQLLPRSIQRRIDRHRDIWQATIKRNYGWLDRRRLKRRLIDVLIQKVPSWAVVLSTAVVLAGLTLWIEAGNKPLTSLRDVLVALLDRADVIALVSGIMLYFREIPDRRQQRHLEAWKVIDLAAGLSTSYARIQALEELVEDGIPLDGLDASQADLKRIQLKAAILVEANLQEANLEGADLRGADLRQALLQGANLQWAALQESNLEEAKLQGANLRYAALGETNLRAANLEGAFLGSVNLEQTRSLRDSHLAKAIYDRQTRFPEGFDPYAAGMILAP